MRTGRVVLLSVALALAACSSSPGSSVPATTQAHGPVGAVVDLKFISFTPRTVTIHAGQAVEWKFQDSPVMHNVTFPGFASPTEASGTFFHTFARAGTFQYGCTIHVNMTGTVVVLP